MRAIVYHKFQDPLTIQQVADPTPSSDGVVIKVAASGLCRSDWHGWMGHDTDIQLPHVPGHEWSGTIEALGKHVTGFELGERVTAPFVCGCGHCVSCQSGNQHICDHQSQPGFTHWGSFAEYVQIDQAQLNLVKLPPEIDDVTASILGCRFITAFRAIVEQGKVKEGNQVVIHGCGGVGLSAVMIAKALGAQVTAVDINDSTLALAQSIGADHLVNVTKQTKLASVIKDITHGGAHISMDALGSLETCRNSIASLRKQGKHLQVGLMVGADQFTSIEMNQIMSDELEIIGSHGMQAHKYPEMLQMIVEGKLKPQSLIERTIGLSDVIHELPNMNQFNNRGVLVITDFNA